MKVLFEDKSTATKACSTNEKVVALYQGRDYKYIGKSYRKLTMPWRFERCLELVALIALTALSAGTLLLIYDFRHHMKTKGKEMISAREKIRHYTPTVAEIMKSQNVAKNRLELLLRRAQSTLFDKINHQTNGVENNAELKPCTSACILVEIPFANGLIKNSFELVNPNNAPLTADYITQQIQNIKVIIENEFSIEKGCFIKYHHNEGLSKVSPAEGRWTLDEPSAKLMDRSQHVFIF